MSTHFVSVCKLERLKCLQTKSELIFFPCDRKKSGKILKTESVSFELTSMVW